MKLKLSHTLLGVIGAAAIGSVVGISAAEFTHGGQQLRETRNKLDGCVNGATGLQAQLDQLAEEITALQAEMSDLPDPATLSSSESAELMRKVTLIEISIRRKNVKCIELLAQITKFQEDSDCNPEQLRSSI